MIHGEISIEVLSGPYEPIMRSAQKTKFKMLKKFKRKFVMYMQTFYVGSKVFWGKRKIYVACEKDKKYPMNSNTEPWNFFPFYMRHKNIPISQKLICKHRMSGCKCGYVFFFLHFEMCFQTIGSYTPGSRITYPCRTIL
jgi:hypothetical protein